MLTEIKKKVQMLCGHITNKNYKMKNYLIASILKSKKVWYTIAAVVVPFIAEAIGADEQSVENIFWALVSLTGAQGIADIGKEAKKK